MLIGLDEDMNPIDIELIWLKVNVSGITFVKINGFPSLSWELFRAFIIISIGEGLIPIDFCVL